MGRLFLRGKVLNLDGRLTRAFDQDMPATAKLVGARSQSDFCIVCHAPCIARPAVNCRLDFKRCHYRQRSPAGPAKPDARDSAFSDT
jgi:hypothetical protein